MVLSLVYLGMFGFRKIPASCIENGKLPLSLSGEQQEKLSEDIDTEEFIT